ncbi:gag-pol polyprotein [Cucumis melo var. makuwa]|uniref:Gag-pol polyprotein n=1 Tax=Cucumis melo var. makuwa TaxID=1194695 RepID=A0A5D3CAC5_CUCMM|nr:gag-pol polyprotein [Cucumis melo var. makuwa]TYK07259.1 gag-pol polyprotein [Cucumis melo var. makuwa]
MDKAKLKRTPAATHLKMTKDTIGEKADPRTSHLYSAKRILKYITGNNIAAWFSKKQNSVSLSTTAAEYIAARSTCLQLLWMKQMLDEYCVPQSTMVLYCDNMSAISISKNPVHHSHTKHIDI